MRTSATLAMFAAALVVVFGVAFGVGGAVGPTGETSTHDSSHSKTSRGAHEGHAADAATTASAGLPGLASSESGYTFAPTTTTLRRGSGVTFEFAIDGPNGQPVTAYTRTHEKDLHLIVVRRDLQYFQHVHPRRSAEGNWTAELDLPAGGVYRAFADFQPTAQAQGLVLGLDLLVPGNFDPVPLAEPVASSARVDGYQVALHGAPTAGRETELTFTVTRNGRDVTDLQPYLGAFGHLVSLRAGDLAYLHTHPAQEASDGARGGPAVRFSTAFPTAGRYRLFLDFKVGGVVRTAAFDVSVPKPARGGDATPESSAPETSAPAPRSGETTDTHGH